MADRAYLDAQQVRQQIERLKLLFPELAEDAELLADTLEGETDLHEVMTRLVRQERHAHAIAIAIESEEDALYARRARFQRQHEMTRSLIQSLMEAAGQSKLQLPIATISLRNGVLSSVITDEAALPPAFVRIKREPDKTKITAALKEGQTVPGADLRNGAPYLTVRV